jgi:hypothetical protein
MSGPKRINRRSFLGRVTGSVMLGGAASLIISRPASATDRDPNDPVTRPTVTDRDPTDLPDRPRSATGFTGYTDRDQVDGAGRGRPGGSGLTDHDGVDRMGHGVGRAGPTESRRLGEPPRTRTGVTDRDQSDGPGYGQGNPTRGRTGLTDRDPSDGVGYGHTGSVVNPRAGSGSTDRDANDPAGRGRGGGTIGGNNPGAPPAGNGPTTGGLTDHDPSDAPGNGRGSVH